VAAPDLVHSERDVLQRFLDKMRNAVVADSEGLSDQDARTPGVPSGTSILGIVQHLAGVERHWFQLVFLDRDIECNQSFDVPSSVSRDEVVADYRRACVESDEVIRTCADLSTLSLGLNPGEHEHGALRRIIAHMIEETGRHAGQADILRELIDGSTGL
jgi:uncharacterized damage-inducible protein DinB